MAKMEHAPLMSGVAPPPEEFIPAIEQRHEDDDIELPSPKSSLADLGRVTRRLYTSHFLSTWNTRSFEFGAVLFLADIYPGTLLPMSVYALVRALSAILCASSIGRYIDSQERLHVVRVSIVYQRLAVVLSCFAFLVLIELRERDRLHAALSIAVFTILTALACVEKTCSVMNTIAVERDWVVVICDGQEAHLRVLNSQMRRIDLLCKLLGPLAIALVDGMSHRIAVWSTLAINTACIGVEYGLIAKVFALVPALGVSRSHDPFYDPLSRSLSSSSSSSSSSSLSSSTAPPHHPSSCFRTMPSLALLTSRDVRFYIQHRAFLASLSLSLLYFTVLSFSGQMTTYLLASGFSPSLVGVLRSASAVSELSATWLAPVVAARIGATRAGIWFLTWQLACLAAGVVGFWSLLPLNISASTHTSSTRPTSAPPSASAASALSAACWLIAGVIFSRAGLWGFDLSAQTLIAAELGADAGVGGGVGGEARSGAFSAVETGLQHAFELAAVAATVLFPRPQDFRYPVTASLAATALAAALYAKFVRDRRGHLLHTPACLKMIKTTKGGGGGGGSGGDRSRDRRGSVLG